MTIRPFPLPRIVALILLLLGLTFMPAHRANAAAAGAAAASADSAARAVRLGSSPESTAHVWLESSLKRVFPDDAPGSTELSLLAPRNARASLQIAVRTGDLVKTATTCSVVDADDLKPRVRFVGLVPVPHHAPGTPLSDLDGLGSIPGMVPDPLMPWSKAEIGPRQSRSYWLSLQIPADAKPGVRTLTVKMTLRGDDKEAKESVVELPVKLEIASLVVQPRKDFSVTHWWWGTTTWDYYKTGMLEDEKWWQITRNQMQDLWDHGNDVAFVPMLFMRVEIVKRPCQLLIVNEPSPGKYTFDWKHVKRFTDMCREIGYRKFEWPHMWIYWGVKHPMRVYTEKQPGKYELLWPGDISGFSDTYLNYLRQFFPEFKAFLDRERLLDGSYFHLSDEPHADHIENYRKARQILHELAPWLKTMDALSSIEYGKQGVTDMPIPIVSSAQAYIDAKIPHWVYYCTGPRGKWLNRFCDTPLAKIRMSGWLFYRLEARGFLHWGYNFWNKESSEELLDPFSDATAGGAYPAGDPFVVYPGKDGTMLDSIRWEVFAESLQDYAILQTADVRPNDPMLAEIKSYEDFPKAEGWIRQATETVLRKPAQAATAQ